MPIDKKIATASPATVAVAGWLLPGAGYWLLGQRGRALACGITIVVLFVGGLLIGGVRVLEVPGFGTHGQELMVAQVLQRNRDDDRWDLRNEIVSENIPADTEGQKFKVVGSVMQQHPLDEIRAKIWSVPQAMTGPIAFAFGVWSVYASRPISSFNEQRVGGRSHSHLNEIGVLYTAVAGLLNLMVIIDAAHRAGQVRMSSEGV